MARLVCGCLVAALLPAARAALRGTAAVPLVTFDGAKATTQSWREVNDPVMGGLSTGTFTVDKADGVGVFDGEVKIVPKLKAPGFCNMQTSRARFADASGADALQLVVRSSIPYTGFKAAFGPAPRTGWFASYKADFNVTMSKEWQTVIIPFSSFSSKWSSYTGEPTTKCSKDHPEVCPDAKHLARITSMEITAEGVAGKFRLEVKSISAVHTGATVPAPTAPAAVAATGGVVSLITFDGTTDGAAHKFSELNDPVMGGQSTGTFKVDQSSKIGVFDGEVKIVPKLQAPGFIEAWADDGHYNDASSAIGGDLVLTVRSSTPSYNGFQVSFAAGAFSPMFSCAGGGGLPGSRGCFKAHFTVPATEEGEWATVRVPFASFTDKWSSATGKPTKTCAEDKSVCVTAKKLKKIQALGLWGEGVAGKLNLQIKSIEAHPASMRPTTLAAASAAALAHAAPSPPARPPKQFDTCKGAVQNGLRYNISALGASDLTAPVAVNPDESLATAICCDNRTKVYAEPRFLFQSPFVNLYAHMDPKGVTTFYDSVCGIPLFHAPLNRTFAEWQADTNEHGWPSFRPAEIVKEHVRTDKDGFVYSSCGTHLGSYLPDDKGPRWCLDLSCLAGNPAK